VLRVALVSARAPFLQRCGPLVSAACEGMRAVTADNVQVNQTFYRSLATETRHVLALVDTRTDRSMCVELLRELYHRSARTAVGLWPDWSSWSGGAIPPGLATVPAAAVLEGALSHKEALDVETIRVWIRRALRTAAAADTLALFGRRLPDLAPRLIASIAANPLGLRSVASLANAMCVHQRVVRRGPV
jgi:hypothetical protein